MHNSAKRYPRVYVYISPDDRPLDGAWVSLEDETGQQLGYGYADSACDLLTFLADLGVEHYRLSEPTGDLPRLRMIHNTFQEIVQHALAELGGKINSR